jgi:hypothetical protein
MVAGRPREYDREEIFKQLLQWAELDTSINLNEFCFFFCNPKVSLKTLIVLSKETPEFSESYAIAKCACHVRRERANSLKTLSDAAFNRNARRYDYLEMEGYIEEKTFESSLRKDEDGKKYTEVHIKVTNDGLGAGLNISTEALSASPNQSP